MSIKDVPATRLKGFEKFISDGIMSGELDIGMNVMGLLALLQGIQIDKDKHLQKKMNGVIDDYEYK